MTTIACHFWSVQSITITQKTIIQGCTTCGLAAACGLQ